MNAYVDANNVKEIQITLTVALGSETLPRLGLEL